MEVFGYVHLACGVCALSTGEEARRKIRGQKRAERKERVQEKIESLKAKLTG